MTRVCWSFEAVRQVHTAVAYVRRYDLRAADDVFQRLFALGDSLKIFPHRGRRTDEDLRQMAGVPPYVLTYEVTDDEVLILDVRHGRRRPYRRRR